MSSAWLLMTSGGTWRPRTRTPHPAGQVPGRTCPLTQCSLQVQVDDNNFVHIRVFESLPHENKPLTLHDYQADKTEKDELAYF